jgi:hypothetical protein
MKKKEITDLLISRKELEKKIKRGSRRSRNLDYEKHPE